MADKDDVLDSEAHIQVPVRPEEAKAAGRAFRTLFGRKRKRHHKDYPQRPNPFRQPPPAEPDPR